MTRDEFYEDVYDVPTILLFCDCYDLNYPVEKFYDQDDIVKYLHNEFDLETIRSLIDCIDLDYEYFIFENGFDGEYFRGVDDCLLDELLRDVEEQYESDIGFEDDDLDNVEEEQLIVSNEDFLAMIGA